MTVQVRRNTRQRQMILQTLRSTRAHPTAGELFRMVRLELPTISLGTVYRNLEVLADSGQVVRLDCGHHESRYDGVVDPHTHVLCRICESVADVDLSLPDLDALIGTSVDGFEVTGHSLLLHGICRACRD